MKICLDIDSIRVLSLFLHGLLKEGRRRNGKIKILVHRKITIFSSFSFSYCTQIPTLLFSHFIFDRLVARKIIRETTHAFRTNIRARINKIFNYWCVFHLNPLVIKTTDSISHNRFEMKLSTMGLWISGISLAWHARGRGFEFP